MKTSTVLLALFVLPPLFLGCSMAKSSGESAEPVPSRQRVQRLASRASVWRFVYCVEESASATALVDLLHEVAASQPFGKRIEVVDCHNLSADTLGAGPLAIFGNLVPTSDTPDAVQRREDGWRLPFDHRLGEDDVLFLPLRQNPWSSGHTVTSYFLSANTERLIERLRTEYGDQWGRIFWRNWAYELHRANGDRIYGSYRDTTWAFDPAAEITLETPEEPVYAEGNLKIFSYDGVVLPHEVSRTARSLHTIRRAVDSLTESAGAWFPEVRLYPNLERIGLRTGQMRPVQYTADKRVLHLVPSFVDSSALLRDLTTWAPFVLERYPETKNLPEETLLLQAQVATESVFAAAFAPELVTGAALHKMRQLPESADEFRSELLATAQDRYRIFTRENGDLRMGTTGVRKRKDPGFLAGMTFAHEGYRVHNGYGGEKIKPSLDSLAELNVNALAVVPYTFMRNADRPTRLFIPRAAGQENDWATAYSLREAKRKGWFTLLKPQIWLGNGSWPGDVAFATAAAWDTWFAGYRYWILHYAVLAERENVDALCLGTELVKTTLQHPERWRALIADVRKVYHGKLTYAANWGEEFENFSFWSELDAIGLNSYYPIHDGTSPDQEALNAGARKWLDMAAAVSRKTGKPLWLTEVGYRSVEHAWLNPHAEAGDRPANNAHQAACYEALLTAARATPELRGMFIWKWPSYLGYDRSGGTRFTPGGKPAAGKLGAFYGDRTR